VYPDIGWRTVGVARLAHVARNRYPPGSSLRAAVTAPVPSTVISTTGAVTGDMDGDGDPNREADDDAPAGLAADSGDGDVDGEPQAATGPMARHATITTALMAPTPDPR
jgi:hypothetical protein